MPKRLSRFSANIKDVYIELTDYEFVHSPFSEELPTARFIGRENIKNRIRAILQNSASQSGAYLVTGFRGMGKTSLIRQVISEFRQDQLEKRASNEDASNEGNNKEKSWFKSLLQRLIQTATGTTEASKKDFRRWRIRTLKFVAVIAMMAFLVFRSYQANGLGTGYLKTLRDFLNNFSKKPPYETFGSAETGFFVLALGVGLLVIFSIVTLVRTSRVPFVRSLFTLSVFAFSGLVSVIIVSLLVKESGISTPISSIVGKERIEIVFEIFILVNKLTAVYVLVVLAFILWDLIFSAVPDISNYAVRRFLRSTFSSNGDDFPKAYESFEISLSQETLNDLDLLSRMVTALDDYWAQNHRRLGGDTFNRPIYLPIRFAIKLFTRRNFNDYGPSYASVHAKLKSLRTRLSGRVTNKEEEKRTQGLSAKLFDGVAELSVPFGGTTKNNEISYQVANAKEAEYELTRILNEIDELRSVWQSRIPRFAFVIDELDKIETGYIDRPTDGALRFDDTNPIRLRRDAVGKVLANLKGFLNNAKARFFFIGGREMFDADLADIADRESFYSSVFNDVIYVDSFFKDTTTPEVGKSGVAQMTEHYLCKLILKTEKNATDHDEAFSLSSLFRRIKMSKTVTSRHSNEEVPFLEIDGDKDLKGGDSDSDFDLQRFKALILLQQYVVYLCYRSNGTPKKLTNLIEQLLVRGPASDSKGRFWEDSVVLWSTPPDKDKECDESGTWNFSNRTFLKFGFYTQYELGLTSNLYRPYLIANGRNMKSMGDKLLFSSSFIIDHILKFHPFGFSWRNLELMPEVVLTNREPNLREFIEELMRFYSQNYIRDTVSGIFDYRFRSIIRRELVHLSKTSELSAAAFNFTLDETLSTKRHYIRKLKELNEQYSAQGQPPVERNFVHSISFIQNILGDLHFYDKEYDEAITYYTESIQHLRMPNAISDRLITRHQFLLWLRSKLKLGLTLEKVRAFDSAFSIYKTLVLDTERYLEQIVKKGVDSGRPGLFDAFFADAAASDNVAEDHRTIQLVSMPFIALLAVTEKTRNDGITYTNLFANREHFHRTIGAPLNKTDSGNFLGDSTENLTNDAYRKSFLLGDYYNNVGSILFYKNCQFPRLFDNKKFVLDAFARKDDKILNSEDEIYLKRDAVQDKLKPEFFPSFAAFNYYWNSLYFLTKYHSDRLSKRIEKARAGFDAQDLLTLTSGYLYPECADMLGSGRLYYIANVVAKIGDSILSSLKERNDFDPSSLGIDSFLAESSLHRSNVNSIAKVFAEQFESDFFSAKTALLCYTLAAALYRRAGYHAHFSSHIIRILYLVKDLLSSSNADKEKALSSGNADKIMEFAKRLAELVFRASTYNNDGANRMQITKYREIFDDNEKERHIVLNSINNTSDVREALLLVEGIRLKLRPTKLTAEFINEFVRSRNLISSYGIINSRYIRMLELKYRTERCFFIFKDILGFGELFKENGTIDVELLTKKVNEELQGNLKFLETIIAGVDNLTVGRAARFLISEALFCTNQLVKMIKMYSPGYVIGYTFMAESHKRMGDWCMAYVQITKCLRNSISTPCQDSNKSEKRHKLVSSIRARISRHGKVSSPQTNGLIDCFDNECAHIEVRLRTLSSSETDTDSPYANTKTDEYKSRLVLRAVISGLKRASKCAERISRELEVAGKQNGKKSDDETHLGNSLTNLINEYQSELDWISEKRNRKILLNEIESSVKKIFGSDYLLMIDPKMHYEAASMYYQKLLQMHSDGRAYRDKLHEIYMLEDDYNDNVAHYTIAAERYRINTGRVSKILGELSKKTAADEVYVYDNYLMPKEDSSK